MTTLKWITSHFPLLFLLFLCLLGGIMSGALYTQNKLQSNGDLSQITDQAQPAARVLSDNLAELPSQMSAWITAQFKQLPPTLTGSVPGKDSGTQVIKGSADLASPLSSGIDPLTAISVATQEDHYQGNLDAKVVLIEYGDFECPFCAEFEPTMDRLTTEYGDRIGRVFRHFPLANHPHAQQAAEASECVAKQQGNEGFWKFNDSIYAQNTALGGSLTPEAITKAAQDAGANMTEWQTCLNSGEMASKVRTDQNQGLQASFAGTPSTVMIVKGGKRFLLPGAVSYSDAKKFIDSYL